MQTILRSAGYAVSILWAVTWRLLCLFVIYRCVTTPSIGAHARLIFGGFAGGAALLPAIIGVADLVPGVIQLRTSGAWLSKRGWHGCGMRDWWWRCGFAGAILVTLVGRDWWSAFGCMVAFLVAREFFAGRRAVNAPRIDSLRGSQILPARILNKLARRKYGSGDVYIGGIAIPRAIEPYHCLLAGGTGQGKSVGITGMLDAIHARGDRAIIADDGGSFLARYGYDARRGDIILNPLDARSIPWSPLAEMRRPHDADAVAHSLIPDAEGEAAQWNRYAQTFMASVLWRVFEVDGDNGSLLFHLLEADMDVLRGMLAGMPAAGLVGKGNERMFGSVRGTVAAYVQGLRYCPDDAGHHAFSLRQWASQGAGWAYFNYLDDQLRVLAPLAGTMLGMVATGVLSQVPDEDRRTWLVLDEVAALGKIGALEDFLTRARKCGGCAIIGLQTIAQLRDRYGRNGAESMLSCLSSQLILNASDPDTAEFLSRSLGDVQVSRQTRSGSRADHGAHANWSQAIQTERLILPSEIASTPKRCGFLKLAGGLPIAPVRLDVPPSTGERAERFVPRDSAGLPRPARGPGSTEMKREPPGLPEFGDGETPRS